MFDSELCFEAHLSKWFCLILGFLVIALAEYFLVANSNHLVFTSLGVCGSPVLLLTIFLFPQFRLLICHLKLGSVIFFFATG